MKGSGLMRPLSVAALAVLLALALQTGAPSAEPAPKVRVAFLQGEQLVQIRRPGRSAVDAVDRLFAGLTGAESAKSYRTYVPPATRLRRLTVRDGLATVDVNGGFLSRQSDERLLASLSQLVQTLSWVPGVTRVRLLVEGRSVQRTVSGIRLGRPITVSYLATPNVPVPQPPPLRLPPPDSATKDAQQRLIELGYLMAGDADGRLGPTTGEGILAFQKFERLARTGVLDGPTRARLETATYPMCRTVALLRVPVISSVGHHTDRTLIDDVAAVACSTPTHAAEAAVPVNCGEARAALHGLAARLEHRSRLAIVERARVLARLSRAPSDHIARHRARLHQHARELGASSRRGVAGATRHTSTTALVLERKARAAAGAERVQRGRDLERLALALAAHEPQRTLERGYALVEDPSGEPVTSAAAAREHAQLTVRMHDGTVSVRPRPENQGS